MRNGLVTAAVLVLLCASALPASAQQSTSAKHHTRARHIHKRHHSRHATTAQRPFVNQGPTPPPPQPEVVVAAPPPIVVTYYQGELAITAQNAELRQVLDKVHEATGAPVESPLLEQRITVRLGPQAPVQAVAALIDGLHLDYAVLGGTGANDPVRRIILSTRLPKGHETAALNSASSGMDQFPSRAPAMTPADEPDGSEGLREGMPASVAPARRNRD